MPVHTVEHWEEKARKAEATATEMRSGAAKQAMLEIAELYRKLAEQTRKLTAAGGEEK